MPVAMVKLVVQFVQMHVLESPAALYPEIPGLAFSGAAHGYCALAAPWANAAQQVCGVRALTEM